MAAPTADHERRAMLSVVIPERLETSRLILMAAKADQAGETYEAAAESAAELCQWMPWAWPQPQLDNVTEYHQMAEAKWSTRELLDYQWYDKSSGRLVGKGGFHTINWAVPKLEIGYWLRTSETGRGYCVEAVNAMVALAFESLKAIRLEICCDPRNVRSRLVAERCGFVLEGILRSNMRNPEGALRDSCMYAKVVV